MSDSPDHLSRRKFDETDADWPRMIASAAAALERRCAHDPEISPRDAALVVADVLPGALGRWLLATLDSLGWLAADARIPFDALDAGECSRDWSGGRRALVRLAVFGLPGQGSTSNWKHREAIFEQRCAEILRESRDIESLSFAASRALGHPVVAADPMLADMLRSFIAQRESELRSRFRNQHPELETESQLEHAFDQSEARRQREFEGHRKILAKLRLNLEDCLTHYHELGAASALEKIRSMHEQLPDVCSAKTLRGCEEQVTRLTEKLKTFREQLGQLGRQGSQAAAAGEQEKALWIARRIDAVRTLLPAVITDQQSESLRGSILKGVEQFEHQQVARKILAQEQAVADQIKRLGAIIHRFHKLAREASEDDEVYQQAKADYVRAVQEVRARDEDWLADLMLSLDALLEDLQDHTGQSESHVDQFLENVRAALIHLRREIRSAQIEGQPNSATRRPAQP